MDTSPPGAVTRIGGDWIVTDARKYIWDGWLQLAELDALDTESGGRARLLKTYVWGLDIAGQSGGGGSAGGGSAGSGSAGRDAAAGIGGLLAVYDTSGTTTGGDPTADDKMFYYCYDANGHVGQLVDWRDAAVTPAGANWAASRVVAAYEYDPYGGIVSETGSYATSNRWRFSTREFDAVTGMGHWADWYYSPRQGRRTSRQHPDEDDGFASCAPHMIVVSLTAHRSNAYFMDDEGDTGVKGHGNTFCNSATGKTESYLEESCYGDCIARHEKVHERQLSSCCARYAKCVKRSGWATCKTRWSAWMTKNRDWAECQAYRDSVYCYDKLVSKCDKCDCGPPSEDCCNELRFWARFARERRDKHCGQAQPRYRCPFDSEGNIRTSVILGTLP